MNSDLSRIIDESIGTWGVHVQLSIVQEACAEAIAAIGWGRRHGQQVEELVEVAAGLALAVAALRLIIGEEAVDAQVARKLESVDVDLCMYRVANPPMSGAA